MDQSLDDLPKTIGGQFDAKLFSLKTELIEKFFLDSKKYTEAGNLGDAAAALRAGGVLLDMARESGEKPNAEFFEKAAQSLKFVSERSPHGILSKWDKPLYQTGISLAEYRLAVVPPPAPPAPETQLNCMTLGQQMFGVPNFVPGKPLPSVRDLSIIGRSTCFQTLDNRAWRNVTFENMIIIYEGGPLILDHVRFINCQLRIAVIRQGTELATSIASGSPTIKIDAPA